MTRKKSIKLIAVLLACAGLLAAVYWGVRLIQRGRRDAETMRCVASIGAALRSYHAEHGCYPPAYTVDEYGNRMHSWRVLILPYLGLQELYDRYDFNEPWNGPHNRLLAAVMPLEYHSPTDDPESTATHFLAIVGEETAWPGSRPLKQSDFRDGTHNTIMLIEAGNEAVPWMEPRDLSVDQLKNGFARRNEDGIRGFHSDRIPAADGGGSFCWLPADISPRVLRAALTIAGGERLYPSSETGEFTLDDE